MSLYRHAPVPHRDVPLKKVIKELVIQLEEGHYKRALRDAKSIYMLGASQKVVLFTSTQPGEGKSFIAGNTAVSLAYMGKNCLLYTS